MRILAYIVSILFHPLLMLTYGLLLMLWVNPYPFGAPGLQEKVPLLIEIFSYTFVLPVFAVIMFKNTGLIESYEMKQAKERIGPYIASGVLYLWTFQNITGNYQIPPIFKTFVLGATIGLFLAFFINNFTKISAHTVGMGGLLGLMMLIITQYYLGYFSVTLPNGWQWQLSTLQLLMMVALVAGLVGSARLWLRAHRPAEVYGGYLVGFGAQLIALQFVLN